MGNLFNKNNSHKRKSKAKRPEWMTDDLYNIVSILAYLGMNEKLILGLMNSLKNDEFAQGKMLDYLIYKKESLREADLLNYFLLLTDANNQFYPPNMIVKYIGDNSDELTPGELYRVVLVRGANDDVYIIDGNAYDSALFVRVQETKIKHVGLEIEPGKMEYNPDLEIDKEYRVISRNWDNSMLILENGVECLFVFTEPLEFETMPLPKLEPLDFDKAILCVKKALEFNRLKSLAEILSHESELVSDSNGRYFKGKQEILSYLNEKSEAILNNSIIVECFEAKLTQDFELENTHKVGEKIIVIKYSCGKTSFAFVNIGENYIRKITITDQECSYEIIS